MRLFTTTLFSIMATLLAAQPVNTTVVAKKLMDEIAAGAPGDFYPVHLVLEDRVDLAGLDARLSFQKSTPQERSKAVVTALQKKAQQTQGGLLSFLKNSPLVKAGTVRPYWVTNLIFAQMKKEMIAELSQRRDVAWIGLNGKLELEQFEELPPAPPVSPGGREPGLAAIQAPALWALGYTGYGQLAFTNDTGVDPTHPALAARYRGLYVPKEQTWFEVDSTLAPTGNFTPFDCHYHGTHVTGTMLGLDRLNDDTIGVAFNAQWIAAPTVTPCSNGHSEDNAAAFQWSLDPDGDPSTSYDIPAVINNSWYDGGLDTIDCFSFYVPILEAMEAAGIAVVFSAGNSGPGPMTITPPHNINLNLVNSFSIGALDGNAASLPIADFSSHGPSHCEAADSSLLIKPEVSAPGVNIRSCRPGNTYGPLSGTSMAAPHVSGAILLLKEAFPYLTGKELKLALYHSCTDLGAPGEDNTYGMGIINVMAAYDYLVGQGHVPVPPQRANDVMLVDVHLPPASCNEEIAPGILVENAGTDTLFSFEAYYEAGPANHTYRWSGKLAPRERSKLQLTPMAASTGEYELTVSLQKPNGLEDERPLNDLFTLPVKVTSRQRFQAQAAGAVPAVVCENTPALLRGGYLGQGQVKVKWYDVPFGGGPIGEGPVFATPPLAQPTTFYAEANYSQHAGLENKEAGDGMYSDSTDRGLVFNVYHDIVLKSVAVHVERTGGRLIELRDANNDIIFTAVRFANDTGQVRFNLDWAIGPGTGYRLTKQGGRPFYHNTSGASYPYPIEGIMEITGTTDGQGTAGAYYYYYDWEVEYAEPCGRSAVAVGVAPAGSVPGASFSVSQDSLHLPDNGAVNFTNTSTDNVASWYWDFGDGATSRLESPSHSYSAPGAYIVNLSVVGLDGCTAFALDTIAVQETQISAVEPTVPIIDNMAVFPNPVRDAFQVHFDLARPKPVAIRVVDLMGRMVKSHTLAAVQKDVLRLEARDLPAGVYFLLVEMEGGASVWRVVKM